jgi:transcription initiation factor TFIIB
MEEKAARARTGAPMSLMIPDKGLSTTIGWSMRDASGRALKGSTRAAMYRMRKWQIRSIAHNSEIRNLSIALRELDRLASNLGVSRDAKDTASFIYRKALSKRLVRGRSIEGMMSGAVYIACRMHKTPRQLDELANESVSTRREIGKCVRQLIRYLNLKVPIPSATNLIPRVAAELKLEGRTTIRAGSIIHDAKKNGITAGKDPGGIAGAAIYIAGILEEDRRTQREIAEAVNVTEVTIRNRYKELARKLKISAL